MHENHKNIDPLFQKSLTNIEVDAPHDVWEKVQEHFYQKRKQKRIQLVISITATMAVILAAYLGYFIGKQRANSKIQFVNKTYNLTNIPANDSEKAFSAIATDLINDIPSQISHAIAESLMANNVKKLSEHMNIKLPVASFNDDNNQKVSLGSDTTNNTGNFYANQVDELKENNELEEPISIAEITQKQSENNSNRYFVDSISLSTYPVYANLDTSIEKSSYERKTNYFKNFFILATLAPVYAYRTIQSEFSSIFSQYEKPYIIFWRSICLYSKKKFLDRCRIILYTNGRNYSKYIYTFGCI